MASLNSVKPLIFVVITGFLFTLQAFANQTMYSTAPMALRSNPYFEQTPQWVSGSFQIGTSFTVIDNQSHPGFMQLQWRDANGQIVTGWAPNDSLSTENPYAQNNTPMQTPELPPNQVCHNQNRRAGEVALRATVTSPVFIQENFGTGLTNCPSLPQLGPGTEIRVVHGQEYGNWRVVSVQTQLHKVISKLFWIQMC